MSDAEVWIPNNLVIGQRPFSIDELKETERTAPDGWGDLSEEIKTVHIVDKAIKFARADSKFRDYGGGKC